MTSYWCEHAALPGGVAPGVRIDVSDGRIDSVATDQPPGDAVRLPGLTVPGFANCHSHAFHRALRARTQRGGGSFWTWREQMYDLAQRLDPDTYYTLARAVFAEMAAAGITSVGEFHYLHHRADGSPYDDPNAMGLAVIEAARAVGVRIALLDTCYLSAGVGRSPEGVQRRFSDGDVAAWCERVQSLSAHARDGVVVGAAAHSVRAVPRDALAVVADWAGRHHAPLHLHLSEQVAENEECVAAYGCTPAELLSAEGVLGPRTSLVHATHLSSADVALIGGAGSFACFCPTTERDLGDGIGPSSALAAAGAGLTLGSDSHAVVDMLEEMRAVELDERLATQRRGHWAAAALLAAGTSTGHASLGFPDAGMLSVGARADLVTIDLDSPRTAGGGATLENLVFAATGADVVHVVCDGAVIADRRGRDDVGRELAAAVAAVWEQP